MRDEFKRASYDVNTHQSRAKEAKVMTESGGGSVWSFLQDHVDFVGNQLQLGQGAATTQSKNDQKNLFGATPKECDKVPMEEKLIEVESFWNNVVLLSILAFIAASVCLCAQVDGIAAKAIGGFVVVMSLVCFFIPAVGGIMFGNILKECNAENGIFRALNGPVACYRHIKGILTVGVAMMTAVTGLLVVKAGVETPKDEGIQQTPKQETSAEQVS
eukprot:symbB.v1.2.000398.t1/scaffold30.1/size407774/14